MRSEMWLALLGAITGLTALSFQLWQFVLSGARIRVKVSQGLSTKQFETTRKLEQMIMIQVANHGRLASSIQSLSLELSWDGLHIRLGAFNRETTRGPDLPVRIEPMSQIMWAISIKMILESQDEKIHIDAVRALAVLSDGRLRRSGIFLINQDGTGWPLYSPFRTKLRKFWKWILKKTRGRNKGRRGRSQPKDVHK